VAESDVLQLQRIQLYVVAVVFIIHGDS